MASTSNISYKHQGLVPIFEERYVLKLNQPDWDVILIDEETSKKHKRDDKYWSQCDGKLLIRKCYRENQGVTTCSSIDKNQYCHYKFKIKI